MNKKILLICMAWVISVCLVIPAVYPLLAAGENPISISDSRVNLSFPTSMTFSAQIKSSSAITDIRLRYQVDQMSFAEVTAEGYVQFSAAASVNASYILDMRRFGGFPPGTTMNYWWAVKDSAANFYESNPVTFTINDNRYKWKNLIEGKIDLYWYTGDNAFARDLMDAAQSALVKLAADTGASPTEPVRIFIYASSSDLQGSMIYSSEWTGGVSFSQYNIITIGISPSNLEWGEGAMTHELTHNVIGQVVFNPYNDLPVWLNEGLAMRYQGELTNQFTAPLAQAIRNNTLLSIKTIASPFSAYSDKANLSYAESYTIVEYLIKTYGSQKMAALLQTFKQGSTADEALKTVLGFDQDQLNQEWQTWVKANYAN